MSTTLRDQVADLSPTWLREDVGGTILRAFGTVLDALCDRTNQGVKLRFPEVGSPTALGYTGNDRNIERGPNQSDATYAAQLRVAFATWRNAGGARTILRQLQLYFPAASIPTMRAVTNAAMWHTIDGGGTVAKLNDGANWNWDGLSRWWRGWIIIESGGRWTLDYWDEIATWGDGGCWGSDIEEGDVLSVNAIVKKWKPANVVEQILITFDAGRLAVGNALVDNVDGTGEDYYWRAAQNISFLEPQVT